MESREFRKSENVDDVRDWGPMLMAPIWDTIESLKHAYENPFESPFSESKLSPNAGSKLSVEAGYRDIEGIQHRPDFILDTLSHQSDVLHPQFETMEALLRYVLPELGYGKMEERAKRNFPGKESVRER